MKRVPLFLIPFVLILVGCGDTPTDSDGATDLPVAIAFAPPASSGVVTRTEAVNGFWVADLDTGLYSTIGFDRVQWCADGAPVGPGFLSYLGTLHGQKAEAPGDGGALKTSAEGILTVINGHYGDCINPVVGVGMGKVLRTYLDGRVTNLSWHGTITTPDGNVHQVSVQKHTQQGPGGTIMISPKLEGF